VGHGKGIASGRASKAGYHLQDPCPIRRKQLPVDPEAPASTGNIGVLQRTIWDVMIDGTVILLQARADECWNPARSGRARRQRAWPSRQAGKASREVQGVAAGDRISGTRSVGLPECLTSPGKRYSNMSACVCLYSVTDSQDQDSSTAMQCTVDGRWTRDRRRCRRSTTGVTDAEVMRVYWPLTIGVTESRLTDMPDTRVSRRRRRRRRGCYSWSGVVPWEGV
jgi:hypothetical protein